jgi:hypothetical protein
MIESNRIQSNEQKEETPYPVPEDLHFLAVWTKSGTFYFKIFCSKKRKSADQRKIFYIWSSQMALSELLLFNAK